MWLVVALTALAHVPQSQVIDTREIRALSTRRGDSWTVRPTGSEGVVVYTEDRDGMEVRHYDANLALRWSTPLPEVVRDAPAVTLYRDDAAWAVFQHRASAVVTRHDLDDGSARAWVVPFQRRSRRVVDLELARDDAWLVLIDVRSDSGGSLHHLDLESGISQEVELPDASGAVQLQRLTADPARGVVDVAYRTEVHGAFTQHVAVADEGRIVHDLVLDVGGINLLDVQRRYFPDGTQLAVGTYADEPTGTRAQGFYGARLDGTGNLLYVATHNFASLDHFFDDLPPERRAARRRIAERRLEEGRHVDIDVRFATHEARWHEGRLVIGGEVHAPRLGTIPRVAVVEIDGGIRAPSLDAPDGYWFTHAVYAAFDPDGSVAWDVSLPLRDVGGPTMGQHVRLGLEGDRATLAYVDGDTLISRVFDAGRLVEDRASRSLVTPDRSASHRSPLVAVPWFDGAWVSYGKQRKVGVGHRFVLERLEVEPPTLPASAEEPRPEVIPELPSDAPPKAVLRPLHQ